MRWFMTRRSRSLRLTTKQRAERQKAGIPPSPIYVPLGAILDEQDHLRSELDHQWSLIHHSDGLSAPNLGPPPHSHTIRTPRLRVHRPSATTSSSFAGMDCRRARASAGPSAPRTPRRVQHRAGPSTLSLQVDSNCGVDSPHMARIEQLFEKANMTERWVRACAPAPHLESMRHSPGRPYQPSTTMSLPGHRAPRLHHRRVEKRVPKGPRAPAVPPTKCKTAMITSSSSVSRTQGRLSPRRQGTRTPGKKTPKAKTPRVRQSYTNAPTPSAYVLTRLRPVNQPMGLGITGLRAGASVCLPSLAFDSGVKEAEIDRARARPAPSTRSSALAAQLNVPLNVPPALATMGMRIGAEQPDEYSPVARILDGY